MSRSCLISIVVSSRDSFDHYQWQGKLLFEICYPLRVYLLSTSFLIHVFRCSQHYHLPYLVFMPASFTPRFHLDCTLADSPGRARSISSAHKLEQDLFTTFPCIPTPDCGVLKLFGWRNRNRMAICWFLLLFVWSACLMSYAT